MNAMCILVKTFHFTLNGWIDMISCTKVLSQKNINFSGNELLCFASFTSWFCQHDLAIVYWFLHH